MIKMKSNKLGMLAMGMAMLATAACSNSGSESGTNDQGKPVSAEGKTVVNFSVRESSSFFEAAEKRFEEKYPDIDLQIQAVKKRKKTGSPEITRSIRKRRIRSCYRARERTFSKWQSCRSNHMQAKSLSQI